MKSNDYHLSESWAEAGRLSPDAATSTLQERRSLISLSKTILEKHINGKSVVYDSNTLGHPIVGAIPSAVTLGNVENRHLPINIL